MRYRRRSFGLYVSMAVAVVAAAACSGESKETPDQILARLRGGAVEPTIPKPTFTLTSHTGEPFDFRKETDGYVTLLFFGYTHCPDICPIHMSAIASALNNLDDDIVERVKVVFVSQDPQRDTPERLAQWLGAFHASFIGLTGDVDEINATVGGIGFAPGRIEETDQENYGVSHPAMVIAYTPDNVGRLLYFAGIGPDDWEHDLPILVQSDWSE